MGTSPDAEELAVLNDLARQLGELRDPGEVLEEVARQARRFLKVDVAYLMLLHDDDRLRIEVADGSIGSTLRGIELSRGEGVGGRVLESGAPLWTRDYRSDPQLSHVPWLDRAAASEHLGGILGVPLVVGDRTIGVLFASDRSPRAFTDHEVRLLAALAAHAALAIHNARLYDQVRSSARTLARTVDLHTRLMGVVLRGGGLPEVVAALEETLPVQVAVLDEHDEALAPDDVALRHEILSDLAPLLGDRASVVFSSADSPPRRGEPGREVLAVPFRLRQSYAGCVVARSTDRLDDDAVRLLESGAMVIATVVAAERAVAEAGQRSRGELLTTILLGSQDASTLRRRALAVGLDPDKVATVAVFDLGTPDDDPVRTLASRFTAECDGWSAEHAGQVVVLLPDEMAGDDVRHQLRRLTATELTGAVGVAACPGGIGGLKRAYQESRQCVAVLRALDREGSVAGAGDMALYRSLFSETGRRELSAFVDAAVGPLLEHDRARQTDLVPTLAAYLAHARHHAATCEDLHIHANTLYGRLDRITEILGEGWRQPDRALEIQVALRLRELADNLPA